MRHTLLCIAAMMSFGVSMATNFDPPTATISYPSPLCESTSAIPVTLTGTGNFMGGTFSASPAGLSIDSITGLITPSSSIVGSYVITYIIPPTTEPGFTTTATVSIVPAPIAGIDGSIAVCENSTIPINLANVITGQQSGGLWTQTSGVGGTFNAASGTYTPAPGSTICTFTYTVSGGTVCPADTSVATVLVQPEVMLVPLTDIVTCQHALAPLLPDVGVIGSWSPSAIGTEVPGTTTYNFTPADGLCASPTSFNVTVVPTPITILLPNFVVTDDSSNDGTAIFDLTTLIPILLNGQPSESFTVSFYETAADAESGINAIANLSSYVNTSNPQTLFITISYNGFSQCHADTTVTLIVDPLLGTSTRDAVDFKYGPNPVSNVLQITAADIISNVAVFTVSGQKMFEDSPQSKEVGISFSSFECGTYFVKINTNSGQKTLRILK